MQRVLLNHSDRPNNPLIHIHAPSSNRIPNKYLSTKQTKHSVRLYNQPLLFGNWVQSKLRSGNSNSATYKTIFSFLFLSPFIPRTQGTVTGNYSERLFLSFFEGLSSLLLEEEEEEEEEERQQQKNY
ncbi:hypothetical protein VNO77_08986 [Canavalia gladiata]|uniref:Uncharacterized protein n=1 Tax=Canavalia gladiata TaxID=3824 RepID=A0AAN9M9K9_CANGL